MVRPMSTGSRLTAASSFRASRPPKRSRRRWSGVRRSKRNGSKTICSKSSMSGNSRLEHFHPVGHVQPPNDQSVEGHAALFLPHPVPWRNPEQRRVGLDFPDVVSAHDQALRAARDLDSAFLARGKDPEDCTVEVENTSGELVVSLSFAAIFNGQAKAVDRHS